MYCTSKNINLKPKEKYNRENKEQNNREQQSTKKKIRELQKKKIRLHLIKINSYLSDRYIISANGRHYKIYCGVL